MKVTFINNKTLSVLRVPVDRVLRSASYFPASRVAYLVLDLILQGYKSLPCVGYRLMDRSFSI